MGSSPGLLMVLDMVISLLKFFLHRCGRRAGFSVRAAAALPLALALVR
jgi:hypothetical protein